MAGPRIPWLLRDMFHRVDDRLVHGWYRSMSVPSERVRRHLRHAGRPFCDPRAPSQPTLIELDGTARWVIDQSRFNATALGGIAGLAGLASVAPEVAATVVAVMRMAQRLAIVYGFDPESDRGQMALWRALAAGFEVDLPDRGPVGIRVSDLPAIVAPRVLAPRTVGGNLAASILRKAAWMVAGRVTRLVPIYSSGTAALNSRRNMAEMGDRMRLVYRRMAEVPHTTRDALEDAVEVGA